MISYRRDPGWITALCAGIGRIRLTIKVFELWPDWWRLELRFRLEHRLIALWVGPVRIALWQEESAE